MQPGAEYRDSPLDRDDEYGSAQEPGRLRAGRPVRRARIGLLLLFAFMTEVIVIAAAANQAVTDSIDKSHHNPRGLTGGFERALETYEWRFTPRAHDVFHVGTGNFALIGTTVVISLLLIFVLVRGPFSFGRAFFGTWVAVAVATMIGGYVRGLVVDTPAYSQRGIPARALFSQLAPGSTVFLGGLVLGLVVAIVVGIFGLITRREDEPVVAGEPGYPDERYAAQQYGDERYGDERYATERYGDERYGDAGGYGSRGYGTADNPTGAVPWQDRYNAPGEAGDAGTHGYEQRAGEPHTDSADTTALPAMTPRQDAERTDPERTAALSNDAPQRAPGSTQAQDAHTTALPRAGESGADAGAAQEQGAAQGQGAAQQTTQFPRPPDDEDIEPEHH
ncbi:hypothetical protein [uncultured Jatrophihabitans sp.]|uniref:hypothetical protein n=1 Tax=uncultured Jatrophihabitans sp. TaxID=1610747 RepID=UPI0035CC7027